MMTENEAYPGTTYSQRCLRLFRPGQKVKIGPAYQMGGTYHHDGDEGTYYIRGPLKPCDYYLTKERGAEAWDVICHASRLIPADEP